MKIRRKTGLESCRNYFMSLRKHARWNVSVILMIGFFSFLIFFRKKFGI